MAGQRGQHIGCALGLLQRDRQVLGVGDTPVSGQMGQLHQHKGKMFLEATGTLGPPTPARSCRGAGVAGSDSSTATADGSCGRFGTLLGKLYPRVSFSSETVLCLLTSQGLPEESKGLEEKS